MSVPYGTKFPQYFSQMLQILWFESDEWFVIFYTFFLAYQFGGLMWVLVPVIPYKFIKAKKRNGRGYFKHLLFSWGLSQMKGYPTYFMRKFSE